MPVPSLDELGAQFTNNPDGTAELKLSTGEVFKGSKDEIIANLTKAKTETRKYADDYKTKYETAQQELASRQPQQTQTTAPASIDAETKRLGDYLWDTLAKSQFGPNASGSQLVQALNQQQEAVQKMNRQTAMADFMTKCPDFPNTDAAGDAVIARLEKDFNVSDFDQLAAYNPELATNYTIAAHRACVAEKIYEPLTAEQVRAASDADAIAAQRGQRPTPPPLVRGGNPEQGGQQYDPWAKDVKLDDLRAAAIRQQLEAK